MRRSGSEPITSARRRDASVFSRRSAAADSGGTGDRPWLIAMAVVGALVFVNATFGHSANWASLLLWGTAVMLWAARRSSRTFSLKLSRSGLTLAVVAIAAVLVGSARHQRALIWFLPLGLSALGINVIVAVWAVRRVRVQLRGTPPDAVVGQPVLTQVVVTGPPTPVWIRMSSLRSAPWLVGAAPVASPYSVVPDARGVYTQASMAVLSTGPLGLVRVVRTHDVALDRPLHVAPRPTPVTGVPLPPTGSGWLPNEEVRGLRAYRAGDLRRHVDAKATARTGALQIREYEPSLGPEVRVRVDLRRPFEVPTTAVTWGLPVRNRPVTAVSGTDQPATERAIGAIGTEAAPDAATAPAEVTASLAAGLVAALFRQHVRVDLETAEPVGIVRGAVHDTVEVGRRLARAIPFDLDPGPLHGGVVVDALGWRWVD